jgi:mannitol/fructose-specific phosphotransferase system IIA component
MRDIKGLKKIVDSQMDKVTNLFESFPIMIEFETDGKTTPIIRGISVEDYEELSNIEPIWIPTSLLT